MKNESTGKSFNIEEKEKTVKNTRPVEITRHFRAPAEEVWNVWKDTQLIKQWWGPEHFSCPEAKIDFKVGGKYLLAMKEEDSGKITWSAGRYNEIIPFRKLVFSDSFADKDGNLISAADAGMPGDWGDLCLVTLEFSFANGVTFMSLKHEGIPDEMHDDCVNGWNSSLDKLQRLVEHTH